MACAAWWRMFHVRRGCFLIGHGICWREIVSGRRNTSDFALVGLWDVISPSCWEAIWRRVGARFHFGILVCLVALAGCVDSSREPEETPGTVSGEFDTSAMLTSFVDNVIVPNYSMLAESLQAFAMADGVLATWCGAIGKAEENDALQATQSAWRDSMAAVQAAEMHVIGPVLTNGEALRQRIHSYSAGPISTCGLDQSVVLRMRNDDLDIRTRSLNQRGFGAIEYLLFNDDLRHTCVPQVPTTQNWHDLTRTDRVSARCRWALDIAADAADAARKVSEQWVDYRTEFLETSIEGDALQWVTDAIFAIDTLVKDRKIGIPTGVHDGCSGYACPGGVESHYSKTSFANVRINVQTFLDLFRGGNASGFDDLIIHKGYPNVSERFVTNAKGVIRVIDAAPSALYDEVLGIDTAAEETACINAFANPDSDTDMTGCRVAGLIKRITDDLKIDFVTIVEVDIPGSAQTDND